MNAISKVIELVLPLALLDLVQKIVLDLLLVALLFGADLVSFVEQLK